MVHKKKITASYLPLQHIGMNMFSIKLSQTGEENDQNSFPRFSYQTEEEEEKENIFAFYDLPLLPPIFSLRNSR